MRLLLICLAGIVTTMAAGCAATFNIELQRAKKSRQPIFIGNLSAGNPDKHGLIDARAQLFNTSGKTYKYVDIGITAYNRVGDAITREGDTSSLIKLRFTGPLRPRRTPGISTWPNVWYVRKIACLSVSRIDITHMDVSVVAISGAMLDGVLASKLSKGCPPLS